jgi:ligand-binding sensor domain-containing protein
VGTSRGLALMRDGRFQVFTAADGLFADNVFSLALNDQGHLWVGGFGGVTRFTTVPGQP